MNDEAMMDVAIDKAKEALAAGEPPFGAALFDASGILIAATHDQVQTLRDMTRHAEIETVRLAVAARGSDLSGCTLVTTVEPCPMCFTAAWLSRVSRIVYGTTMAAVRVATGGVQREVEIPAKLINEMSGNLMEVIGGVREEQCLGAFKKCQQATFLMSAQ